MSNTIKIGNIEFGVGLLPLIAGPCVIESREHSLRMAESIKSIADSVNIPLIFKSSFDKANRTASNSFRGPNMDEGLSILSDVKKEIGVPAVSYTHLTLPTKA